MNTLDLDVTLAMRGDADAYRRVIEQSAGTVCSIALAIVRNVPASEDVAQEVFLSVWTGLRKLRNPLSFLPWLRQVTRNQAHLWLRNHAREQSDEIALASAVDARPSPADELLAEEERRLLAEVLDDLAEDTREVVILYYREGSSAKHVAELLGISEDAVKQRLSRARTKIRSELLARFGIVAERTKPGASFIAGISLETTPLALAFVPAILGVIVGLRGLEPFYDAQEEREMHRFRAQSLLLMITGSLFCALAYELEAPPRWFSLAPLVAFVGAVFYFYLVRLPRILARREDPRDWTREAAKRAAGVVFAGVTFMMLLVRVL
jgi:RNA polymerase sigma factor (sigma-70 family)